MAIVEITEQREKKSEAKRGGGQSEGSYRRDLNAKAVREIVQTHICENYSHGNI